MDVEADEHELTGRVKEDKMIGVHHTSPARRLIVSVRAF